MFEPLDGPSAQGILTVTTTESALRIGPDNFSERWVVTIQPTDGKVYVSFQTGVEGFLIFKNQLVTFEGTDSQTLYIKAVVGTVTVKIAERG